MMRRTRSNQIQRQTPRSGRARRHRRPPRSVTVAYDLTSASPTTVPASGTSTQAEAAPAVSAAKGVGSLIGGGAGASGAASPPAGGAPSASAASTATREPPLPIEDRKAGFISQFERLFASSPELAKIAGYADLKGVAEGVWDKLNSTVAATGAPMAVSASNASRFIA